VEEVVVVSRVRAKGGGGGANWVPCSKLSGGARFYQTTCGGDFTSMGDDLWGEIWRSGRGGGG
jgi:hypothetical protein